MKFIIDRHFIEQLNSLHESTKKLGFFSIMDIRQAFEGSQSQRLVNKMQQLATKERKASRHPDKDFVLQLWRYGKFDSVEAFADEVQTQLNVTASKVAIRTWLKNDTADSKANDR